MLKEDYKLKVINDTITNLEKRYGKGTIMRLGDVPIQKLDVISTGCLSLDYALGVGGIPRGRIVEIFGPQSGGKTTMSLHILSECQKLGGTAAFIDAEHSLSLKYANEIGVDCSQLLLSQPDYGEQALEIVETLVRSGAIDIIVVDSVAALTPKAEIEGDMGQFHLAVQARLMSQAMRKLTALVDKSKTCLIFINQLRDKVGVMFGPTEETPGGKALKFYSSIRIDVRKITSLKNNNEVYGNKTKIKIVKNKVAPPFREVEVDIIFGKGIDVIGDIINLALQLKLITKSGTWFTYKESRFQGRYQLIEFFKNETEIFENLRTNIKDLIESKTFINDTFENKSENNVEEIPE